MTTHNDRENIVERKIGDKLCMVKYEPGGKEYAVKRLDEDEARYLDACETVELDVATLVNELEGVHLQHEDIKQETCAKCGSRALKERRGRMRVFGRLFWTDSKPSPYKHCESCGHDQEYNPYSNPNPDNFRRQAELRIERAKKLKASYEATP